MSYSRTSQLILKNSQIFYKKKILITGNIQDNMPIYLPTEYTKIHTKKYDLWKMFIKFKKCNVQYSLQPSKKTIKNSNSIIYFWPKNKYESRFQIQYLLTYLLKECTLFIVGENKSGIKSAKDIFKQWIDLKLVDYAKHSILLSGNIKKNQIFHSIIF